MKTGTTIRTAALIGAGALALTACGSSGSTGSSEPRKVVTKLVDFKVEPDVGGVPKGDVTLEITNGGTTTHELLVVKTDLAADKLPTDDAGDVSEDGAGLTFIDEREGIEPGKAASLTVHLAKGRYVLLCNLPGHYKKGMATAFTVDADGTLGALASGSSAHEHGEGDSASDMSDHEEPLVSADAVAAGLGQTVEELDALAASLGADPAKAMEDVYRTWYTYEATVRAADQSTYLDLEDQLAAAKRAADAKDPAAMKAAATAFYKLADSYLKAHPGAAPLASSASGTT